MSYKFIVTLPGYDTDTATPEQCAIHSDYPSPKIEPSNFGIVDYVFSSNPGIGVLNLFTKAHGYKYRPAAIVYTKDFQPPVPGYPFYILPVSYPDDCGIIAYTDETNLKIDFYRNAGSTTNVNGYHFKFKYYIFAENG